MNTQQPPHPQPLEGLRKTLSVTFGIGQCCLAVTRTIMNKPGRFGSRWYRFHGILGVVCFPVIGTLIAWNRPAPYEVEILWWFWGMLLLVLFAQQAKRRQLEKQGQSYHTVYDGESRLWPWCGRDEIRVKQMCEPAVLFPLAVALMFLSASLGITLGIYTIGHIVAYEYARLKEKRIVDDLHDAQHEAAKYGSYMREE